MAIGAKQSSTREMIGKPKLIGELSGVDARAAGAYLWGVVTRGPNKNGRMSDAMSLGVSTSAKTPPDTFPIFSMTGALTLHDD